MSTSVRGVGWQASRQFHIAGDADKGPVFVEAEAQVAENDQHVTQGTHGGNKVESRLHRIGDPHSIRRIKMKLGLGGQADEAHTQTASLDDEQSDWIAHAAAPRYTWALRAGDGGGGGVTYQEVELGIGVGARSGARIGLPANEPEGAWRGPKSTWGHRRHAGALPFDRALHHGLKEASPREEE